ncbi:hypothetical protein AAFF_G00116360 [Aldrovandia affinis]|uniref:Uncharacterized protein n=1 Tax=Aldrovandia affinis TaxID=143900 RepID=A0AAD7T1H8_9TELE|nr:hypothetical protein AAFF_G00116360 [Aldrovandia affinis]
MYTPVYRILGHGGREPDGLWHELIKQEFPLKSREAHPEEAPRRAGGLGEAEARSKRDAFRPFLFWR